MISQSMQEALHAQITGELASSNLYLAMSGWSERATYRGFARWLRVQAEEERSHALKLLDFLLARGGTCRLGAIGAPPPTFPSILGLFEAVQAHEREVSEKLDALHAAAVSERDTALQVFLQWFLTEQVEEEAAAAEIVEKLRMVGDRPATILYLDKEYGKRGRAP